MAFRHHVFDEANESAGYGVGLCGGGGPRASSRLSDDARLAAATLDAAAEGSADDVQAALEEIREALVTAPLRYSRPVIIDQLSYLYSNLIRADQQPGQDAVNRYQELNSLLSDHIGRLEQLLRTSNSRGGH